MKGNGKKALLITTLLTLTLFAFQGAVSRSSSGSSAATPDQYRSKMFLLLDLALNPGQPGGQSGQNSGTNLLTRLIQARNDVAEVAGQSTVQVTGTTTSYTLAVRATLKDTAQPGKKYVVWLKDPSGPEAIAVGESASQVVTAGSFTSNRDLGSHSVIVTSEDLTAPAGSPPSQIIIEAIQRAGTGTPDGGSAGGSGSVVPSPSAGGAPTSGQQPTAGQAQPTSEQPTSGQPQSTSQPTSGQQSPTTSADQLTPRIEKAIAEVKQENIRANLQKLVDFESRITGTAGNVAAAQFIKDHFTQHGIEAEFQSFNAGRTPTRNIIGRIYGSDRNSWYIIMAHMDSVVLNPPGSWRPGDPAPGADDNGSGTATVMEIARAIKQSGVELDASLMFILFSAEEQHRSGSAYYVQNTSLAGVHGILNLDMIGNKGPKDNCVDARSKRYTGGHLIADEFVNINRQFNLGLTTSTHKDYNESSDHDRFIEKGIMGAFLFECTMSPHWHMATDTMQHISFSQLEKTGKAVAGTLVKVSHTKLGKGFSGLTDQVLGESDTPAPFFLKVFYTEKDGPHPLYDIAEVPINYYEGETIEKPFFLGLFTQNGVQTLQDRSFAYEVIDDETNLDHYELLWYPVEGGLPLVEQSGYPFTALSPHLFLVEFDGPHEFTHQGTLASFFEIRLPTNSAPPKFKTPLITAIPTPTFEPVETPHEAGRNWQALIAILFGLGTVLVAGIGAYLHKASRT